MCRGKQQQGIDMNRSALEKLIMRGYGESSNRNRAVDEGLSGGVLAEKNAPIPRSSDAASGRGGIVRVSGAERSGQDHHDEAADGPDFSDVGIGASARTLNQ